MAQFGEILTGVWMLDASVGEVLDAKRDSVRSGSSKSQTDCDVVGEVETGGEALALALVDRRHERHADTEFTQPA